MNNATPILAVLLMAFATVIAMADVEAGNPNSPYPPSCITGPLRNIDVTGPSAARFFSDRIWLETAHKIESSDPFKNLGEVQLDMYRVHCAEPNRSVILADFILPREWVDPRLSQLILPWLGGNTGLDPYPLEFKPEANSWGQYPAQLRFSKRAIGDFTGGWNDARWFFWRFIVDVPPEASSDRDDPPKYYNSAFSIFLHRGDGNIFLTIPVPATETTFSQAGDFPLNGRLSGNWVEEGSADQGLLLSFNTPPPAASALDVVPEGTDLLVFLSWFTFDAEGKPLWLTGAARFAQGATEVHIPIEYIGQGTFLGATPGQRSVVGSAHLRARNCNRIELDYDLDELGLDSEVMQLQRPFALEIAGYPCRDYEGLQASIFPPESN